MTAEETLLKIADEVQEDYRYTGGQHHAGRIRAEVARLASSRAAIIERCAKVAEERAKGFPWSSGSNSEVIGRLIRELKW